MLDGVDHHGPPTARLVRQVDAIEQQLPAEQGPVERPLAQHRLTAHRWKRSSGDSR
jgi:hypothetical protein